MMTLQPICEQWILQLGFLDIAPGHFKIYIHAHENLIVPICHRIYRHTSDRQNHFDTIFQNGLVSNTACHCIVFLIGASLLSLFMALVIAHALTMKNSLPYRHNNIACLPTRFKTWYFYFMNAVSFSPSLSFAVSLSHFDFLCSVYFDNLWEIVRPTNKSFFRCFGGILQARECSAQNRDFEMCAVCVH